MEEEEASRAVNADITRSAASCLTENYSYRYTSISTNAPTSSTSGGEWGMVEGRGGGESNDELTRRPVDVPPVELQWMHLPSPTAVIPPSRIHGDFPLPSSRSCAGGGSMHSTSSSSSSVHPSYQWRRRDHFWEQYNAAQRVREGAAKTGGSDSSGSVKRVMVPGPPSPVSSRSCKEEGSDSFSAALSSSTPTAHTTSLPELLVSMEPRPSLAIAGLSALQCPSLSEFHAPLLSVATGERSGVRNGEIPLDKGWGLPESSRKGTTIQEVGRNQEEEKEKKQQQQHQEERSNVFPADGSCRNPRVANGNIAIELASLSSTPPPKTCYAPFLNNSPSSLSSFPSFSYDSPLYSFFTVTPEEYVSVMSSSPTSCSRSSSSFVFDYASSCKLLTLFERFGANPVVVHDRWKYTDHTGMGPRLACPVQFTKRGEGAAIRTAGGWAEAAATGERQERGEREVREVPSVEDIFIHYQQLTSRVMRYRLGLLQHVLQSHRSRTSPPSSSSSSTSSPNSCHLLYTAMQKHPFLSHPLLEKGLPKGKGDATTKGEAGAAGGSVGNANFFASFHLYPPSRSDLYRFLTKNPTTAVLPKKMKEEFPPGLVRPAECNERQKTVGSIEKDAKKEEESLPTSEEENLLPTAKLQEHGAQGGKRMGEEVMGEPRLSGREEGTAFCARRKTEQQHHENENDHGEAKKKPHGIHDDHDDNNHREEGVEDAEEDWSGVKGKRETLRLLLRLEAEVNVVLTKARLAYSSMLPRAAELLHRASFIWDGVASVGPCCRVHLPLPPSHSPLPCEEGSVAERVPATTPAASEGGRADLPCSLHGGGEAELLVEVLRRTASWLRRGTAFSSSLASRTATSPPPSQTFSSPGSRGDMRKTSGEGVGAMRRRSPASQQSCLPSPADDFLPPACCIFPPPPVLFVIDPHLSLHPAPSRCTEAKGPDEQTEGEKKRKRSRALDHEVDYSRADDGDREIEKVDQGEMVEEEEGVGEEEVGDQGKKKKKKVEETQEENEEGGRWRSDHSHSFLSSFSLSSFTLPRDQQGTERGRGGRRKRGRGRFLFGKVSRVSRGRGHTSLKSAQPAYTRGRGRGRRDCGQREEEGGGDTDDNVDDDDEDGEGNGERGGGRRKTRSFSHDTDNSPPQPHHLLSGLLPSSVSSVCAEVEDLLSEWMFRLERMAQVGWLLPPLSPLEFPTPLVVMKEEEENKEGGAEGGENSTKDEKVTEEEVASTSTHLPHRHQFSSGVSVIAKAETSDQAELPPKAVSPYVEIFPANASTRTGAAVMAAAASSHSDEVSTTAPIKSEAGVSSISHSPLQSPSLGCVEAHHHHQSPHTFSAYHEGMDKEEESPQITRSEEERERSPRRQPRGRGGRGRGGRGRGRGGRKGTREENDDSVEERRRREGAIHNGDALSPCASSQDIGEGARGPERMRCSSNRINNYYSNETGTGTGGGGGAGVATSGAVYMNYAGGEWPPEPYLRLVKDVHASGWTNRAHSHLGEAVLLSFPRTAGIPVIFREVEEALEKHLWEHGHALMEGDHPMVSSLVSEIRLLLLQNKTYRKHTQRWESRVLEGLQKVREEAEIQRHVLEEDQRRRVQ